MSKTSKIVIIALLSRAYNPSSINNLIPCPNNRNAIELKISAIPAIEATFL